jgi:serine/threonine protein kinase
MGGTPGYFDPEAPSESRRPRDLYSVGVLIIEMLTGSLPGNARAVTNALSHLDRALTSMWDTAAWESPRDDASARRLLDLAKRCVGPSQGRPTSDDAVLALSAEIPTLLPESSQPARECVICFENPRRIMLLPCRHAVVCQVCLPMLMGRSPPRCPTCRAVITQTVEGNFNTSFVPA